MDQIDWSHGKTMEWDFHRDRWFVSDQSDFGDTFLASGDIGMAKSGIEL